MDRQYSMETIGVLRPWDNVDGLFADKCFHRSRKQNRFDGAKTRPSQAKIALFGWGRHTDRLSSDARPLTYGEIAVEVARYSAYRNSFNTAKTQRSN